MKSFAIQTNLYPVEETDEKNRKKLQNTECSRESVQIEIDGGNSK